LPPQNDKNMDVKLITAEEFEKLKADLINTVREEMAKVNVGGVGADEFLTSKQVCEELGISSRQWQKLRDERRIAFSQFGRKIYVRRSDLNAFIASHRIASRYEQ
jgi:excisionase family DNA binding protein